MKADTSKKIAKVKLTFNESKKITDSVVSKLKAKPKTYFVRDKELAGFWIKLSSGDPAQATYVVNTKPQGSRKDIQRTIGKVSLYKTRQAREIARDWLQQIKAGRDPKAEVKKLHSQSKLLSEAFEQYISDKVTAGTMGDVSVRNYRVDMKGRLATLMGKQINDLTEELINNWYKKNRSETGAQTDRAYRELNAVLNYQVKLKNIDSNPATIVKTLGNRAKPKAKSSFLNTDQLGRIIITLPMFRRENPHLKKQTNVWLFLLLTGLRESTVYNMKWAQVTLRDSVWIETTKNGESYHLPLTPLLNDVLEDQRNIINCSVNPNCEYVFPNKTFTGALVEPKKALNRLYKEADIKKSSNRSVGEEPIYQTFSDHDLRRTFASLADLAKVSYSDIKHLMVHKKRDITEKYMQSQQIKAQDNYRKIIEMLSSIVPITNYTDCDGDEVTHFATPDLLRFMLFNKGKLANHPNKSDPEFLIDQSKTFYNKVTEIDWD